MARCWTCGARVEGNAFTCNSCKQLKAHQATQEEIREASEEISSRLSDIDGTLRSGFEELAGNTAAIRDKLSEIASTLEWGFNSVVWQLQQQDKTLQRIGLTLRTPTATQANEWREIAEGLSDRGAFAQAEEFYTKALSAYPLDYRTYLGLASVHLKMNQFERAQEFLGASLPHAPAEDGFNWKSHSYRLLGHIQACRENYQDATRLLGLAVKLSPKSVEAHYDNALYCAHTGDDASVSRSLAAAIEASPKYWRTSAVASDFREAQPVVDRTRAEFLNRARASHTKAVELARATCKLAGETIERAKAVNARLGTLSPRPNDPSWGLAAEPLECVKALKHATDQLAIASGAKLDDYIESLEQIEFAGKVKEIADQVIAAAEKERIQLLSRFKYAGYTVENERASKISGCKRMAKIFGILAYVLGSMGGCLSRVQTVPGHPVSIFYPVEAYITIGPLCALCVFALFTVFGIVATRTTESIPDTGDL